MTSLRLSWTLLEYCYEPVIRISLHDGEDFVDSIDIPCRAISDPDEYIREQKRTEERLHKRRLEEFMKRPKQPE